MMVCWTPKRRINKIDEDGSSDRTDGAGIDGFGNSEVAEKSYRVYHPDHKASVRDNAVDESQYSLHICSFRYAFVIRPRLNFLTSGTLFRISGYRAKLGINQLPFPEIGGHRKEIKPDEGEAVFSCEVC